jgi:hypothetical protein
MLDWPFGARGRYLLGRAGLQPLERNPFELDLLSHGFAAASPRLPLSIAPRPVRRLQTRETPWATGRSDVREPRRYRVDVESALVAGLAPIAYPRMALAEGGAPREEAVSERRVKEVRLLKMWPIVLDALPRRPDLSVSHGEPHPEAGVRRRGRASNASQADSA